MSAIVRQVIQAPFSVAGGSNFGLTSAVLDATTDKMEIVFYARASITLTRLFIRLTSITGTSPTYKISIQSLDASGNPTGTVLGGGTPASKTFSPSGLGWTASSGHWLTLDNTLAITRGTAYAIVVEYDSGTVDASNFASFTVGVATGMTDGHPYGIDNQAGVRSRQSVQPIYGYGSAGTPYGFPWKSNTNQTFNSGTTPDEYAQAFTLDAGWGDTFKLNGFWLEMTLPAGHSVVATLYSGTTALATMTLDTDANNSPSGTKWVYFPFPDTIPTLTFGTLYRVGVAAQDATNLTIRVQEVEAAADWDAFGLQQAGYMSTRADAGAWSDTLTKMLMCRLDLSEWNEPSASGGVSKLAGAGGGLAA